jgi:hypothetical protein
MGFCTRCGANLGEIEAAIRRGMSPDAERAIPTWIPEGLDEDQMERFLSTAESQPVRVDQPEPSDANRAPRPSDEPPAPDKAPTQSFPKVRRPQAEAREEAQGGTAVWRPSAARTEALGPVQHGGAQAPWIRPAGPGAPSVYLRPFALLGGILGVGACFLPWVRWNFDRTAFHFPLRFLVTGDTSVRMISFGILLVALAGLGLVLSPIRQAAPLRRLVGLLVLAVPVLFGTLGLLPHDLNELVRELGIGAYMAALGGLLLLFG